MTAKTIAHAEQFAVVVSDGERGAVIVTAGAQGPAGKSGAKVSAAPGNQIEEKADGLYAPPATWSIKEW